MHGNIAAWDEVLRELACQRHQMIVIAAALAFRRFRAANAARSAGPPNPNPCSVVIGRQILAARSDFGSKTPITRDRQQQYCSPSRSAYSEFEESSGHD
jgi:hypothetical protein